MGLILFSSLTTTIVNQKLITRSMMKEAKNLNITILTGQNDWFSDHVNDLVHHLKNIRSHNVNLVYNIKDIKEGDICFLLSVYEVVKPDILKLNKNNIVIHESDLPKGKGWSPLYWQVLEGKSEIPVCLFEAVKKVDAGDIYLRDTIHLDGTELVEEIRQKQAKIRVDMALKFVDDYPSCLDRAEHQNPEEETFYGKRTIKDSELDIGKSIDEQFNLLRIVDNKRYPAFFYKEGVKYKLLIKKDAS